MAGVGRRCRAVLYQLSGATLLGRRRARLVDGSAGRSLLLDRNDGRFGARSQNRSGTRQHAQAGITLATAIMYLRILVVVAFFNFDLAWVLAPWLCCLSLAGLIICAVQYRVGKTSGAIKQAEPSAAQRVAANPLELVRRRSSRFSIAVSLVSDWAKAKFGTSGIYTLAAIVGVTNIDPFVLNLAQGGTQA